MLGKLTGLDLNLAILQGLDQKQTQGGGRGVGGWINGVEDGQPSKMG
jgi:hypothetical protein